MKIVAIVQARMLATRLPGKVLADIAGKALITRVIERVNACPAIHSIVVATTTEQADDELVEKLSHSCRSCIFRGSLLDVLDRYYQCARSVGADIVVRITADDPLKDPEIIGRAIQMLLQDPALDYCSNTLDPSYPEGLDVEVFRFGALECAWREAKLASEREHVTPYIWKHTERFRTRNFAMQPNLSTWRWTVDKPNDLEFMRAVFGHFAGQPLVSYRDVITWLEANPQVMQINAGTRRNEGYFKSLEVE